MLQWLNIYLIRGGFNPVPLGTAREREKPIQKPRITLLVPSFIHSLSVY